MNASCRAASELMSAAEDRELSGREQFALRTHLLLCGACRRSRRQWRMLRQMFAAAPAAARTRLASAGIRLSSRRRMEIKQLLRENMSDC